MTTLVMVQKDDDVILGWDSLLTNGYEQTQLIQSKFWVQDGIIYGLAGTLRAGDVIQELDFPTYDGSDPRLWIIREWAPVYREAVSSETAIFDADSGGMKGFALFMVVGGQAFDIDGLISPSQSQTGLYAAGSGSDYAKGALTHGATVIEALEIASEHDAYTGGDLTAKSANSLLDENVPNEQTKYRISISRADQPHKKWGLVLDYSEARKDLGNFLTGLVEVLNATFQADQEYLTEKKLSALKHEGDGWVILGP